jgi:hypothetical protein
MANVFKKGSDNLLNGAILGVIIGYLVATNGTSWIQSIVTTVVNTINQSNWLSFAGDYTTILVWVVIGGIAGYIIDRV